MNKELIKKRFSKSLKTYGDSAQAQSKMAEKLVSLIQDSDYDSVLELGCGVGTATSFLFSEKISNYDAVDIVSGCKNYIKNLSDKINFICEDIEVFNPDKKYDLIFSNATLQWVENLPKFIKKYMEFLNFDGVFAFTIFGEENYKEINSIINGGLSYHTVSEMKTLLKNYQILHLDEEKILLDFKDIKDVLHHIKDTGVNALYEAHWTKKDLQNFEKDFLKINRKIQLTYNPIYIVIKNK